MRRKAANSRATPGPKAEHDSRESLLRAARKLFAEHGLDGTTVRDLAREAGTNLCMVSYHFGGKEGLYRACIEHYGRARITATEPLMAAPQSVEEFRVRLGLLIRTILDSLSTYPEMHRILTREMESGLANARPVFEQTILVLIRRVVGFFSDAQKAGIVRRDVDTFYVTGMLYASLGHMTRIDCTLSKYFKHSLKEPKEREKMAQQITDILLGGCLAKPNS